MSRQTRKWIQPATITILVIGMLLPLRVFAGYPEYAYMPYYQPYSQVPYPHFTRPGSSPGYGSPQGLRRYGYTKPQWYVRGRVNRFGDYRVDIKLRGLSQRDMYYAWLLYNYYGFNK